MLELRGGTEEKKELVGVAIRALLALLSWAWLGMSVTGKEISNRPRIGNA